MTISPSPIRVGEAPPGEQGEDARRPPSMISANQRKRSKPAAATGRGEADAGAQHLRDDLQPADDQGRRVQPPRFGQAHRSHQVLADLGADPVAHRLGLRLRAGPAAAPPRRACRRCAGSGWRGRSGARSAPARRRYAGPGRTARSSAPGPACRAGSRARPRPRHSPRPGSAAAAGPTAPTERRAAAPRRAARTRGTGVSPQRPRSRHAGDRATTAATSAARIRSTLTWSGMRAASSPPPAACVSSCVFVRLHASPPLCRMHRW